LRIGKAFVPLPPVPTPHDKAKIAWIHRGVNAPLTLREERYGTLYVAKPYGYGSGNNDPWYVRVLCHIEEPLRASNPELGLKYWVERVLNFVNKTGYEEWSVNPQTIDSLWEAFKETWREVPVKEKEPMSPLVLAVALPALLLRRPRSL